MEDPAWMRLPRTIRLHYVGKILQDDVLGFETTGNQLTVKMRGGVFEAWEFKGTEHSPPWVLKK